MLGARKIMSAAGVLPSSGSVIYRDAGTYTFTVPAGVLFLTTVKGADGSDGGSGPNAGWYRKSNAFSPQLARRTGVVSIESALASQSGTIPTSGFASSIVGNASNIEVSDDGGSTWGTSTGSTYLSLQGSTIQSDTFLGASLTYESIKSDANSLISTYWAGVTTDSAGETVSAQYNTYNYDADINYGGNTVAFGLNFNDTTTVHNNVPVVPYQTYTLSVGIDRAADNSFLSFAW
jgi:hypothetical protein